MKAPGKTILGKILFTFFFIIPLFILIETPVFIAGGGLGAYLVYSRHLPEIPQLKRYQPRTVSTFYADDGTVIGIFYKQKRFVKELEQVPEHVIRAFLAAEDATFFEHKGVSYQALLRAAISNLKTLAKWLVRGQRPGESLIGASTITMQVTRNFLLTRERKISRKIREMILARRVEEAWGKQQILHIFLNEIYLGDGCYGLEAAARNYFDKPVEHLTVAEGALIAGIVPAPAKFNPFKSEEQAQRRKKVVLDTMLKYAFITQEVYEKALVQKLVFRKEIRKPFDLVPDFTEVVRRYVADKYGADMLYNQGLKVFTTCRVDYQQAAVEAVKKGLAEIRARHKHAAILRSVTRDQIETILEERPTPSLSEGKLYQAIVVKVVQKPKETRLRVALSKKLRGRVVLDKPTRAYRVGNILAVRFERWVDQMAQFKLDDEPVLQSALVAIENRTGYVRALVGGSTGEKFQFNRATQARRQPGSAFKPIIYATALEKKSYSPATVIVDEPIVLELDQYEQEWEPKNAGDDYYGPLSFRRSLELSRNICTIKILMDVKLAPVIDMARRMGITSPLGRNWSLSLGTSELTPLELTSAYTTFANGGIHVEPVLVKRIEDRFGNVLEDNTGIPVLDESQIPRPLPRAEFRELLNWVAPREEFDDPAREISEETLTETNTAPDPQTDTQVLSVPEAPEFKPRKVQAAMSPQTAYIITDLLLGGVRSGTGTPVRKYLKRNDLAGKTGTTNHAEDAWFIGFNPDFTAGVWVGYDEKRPLGPKEYGSRAALPVWGYFMREVLKNRPQKEFPVPPEINFTEMITVTGNKRDGFHPKTVQEPVYAPFVGYTLVLSPLDPPEVLHAYDADFVPQPYSQYQEPPPGGYSQHVYQPPGQYPPQGQEWGTRGVPPQTVPTYPLDGRNRYPQYAPPDSRHQQPESPYQSNEYGPAETYPDQREFQDQGQGQTQRVSPNQAQPVRQYPSTPPPVTRQPVGPRHQQPGSLNPYYQRQPGIPRQ